MGLGSEFEAKTANVHKILRRDEEKTRKGNKLRMIMKISPLLMTPGRCYLMMLHFVVAPSSLWSLTVGKQKGEEKKMKEEKK